MKNLAAVMTDVRKIEIREIEMPVIRTDEVLVKIEYGGICGSDMHWYGEGGIGARRVKPPFILGHEVSGIVCEAGSEVENLKEGDMVALEPGVACGHCDYCKAGRYNLCSSLRFRGAPSWDGLFRTYVAHPANFTHKLMEGMTTLDGVLAEPMSVGLHAAEAGNMGWSKSAAILGAGCIGLTTLFACRRMNAQKVFVTDFYDSHLELARELGADCTVNIREPDAINSISEATGGAGVDVVFEAAGQAASTFQTSQIVGRGGTIVLVGNLPEDMTYNFGRIMLNEAQIKTVWRYCNNFDTAIEIMGSHLEDARKIISDIFEFADIESALLKAMDDKENSIKVVIKMP